MAVFSCFTVGSFVLFCNFCQFSNDCTPLGAEIWFLKRTPVCVLKGGGGRITFHCIALYKDYKVTWMDMASTPQFTLAAQGGEQSGCVKPGGNSPHLTTHHTPCRKPHGGDGGGGCVGERGGPARPAAQPLPGRS